MHASSHHQRDSEHAVSGPTLPHIETLRTFEEKVAEALESLSAENLNSHVAAVLLLFGFLNERGLHNPGKFQSPAAVADRACSFSPHIVGDAEIRAQAGAQLRILAELGLTKMERGCHLLQQLPGLVMESHNAAVLDTIVEALIASRRIFSESQGNLQQPVIRGSVFNTLLRSPSFTGLKRVLKTGNAADSSVIDERRRYQGVDNLQEVDQSYLESAAALGLHTGYPLAEYAISAQALDVMLGEALMEMPIGAGDIMRLEPGSVYETPYAELHTREDGRSFLLCVKQGNSVTRTPLPRLAFGSDKTIVAFTFEINITVAEVEALEAVVRSMFEPDWRLALVYFREEEGFGNSSRVRGLVEKGCPSVDVLSIVTPRFVHRLTPTLPPESVRTVVLPHTNETPRPETLGDNELLHYFRQKDLLVCRHASEIEPVIKRVYQALDRQTRGFELYGQARSDELRGWATASGNISGFAHLLAAEAISAAGDRNKYFLEIHDAMHQITDSLRFSPQQHLIIQELARILEDGRSQFPGASDAPPRVVSAYPRFFLSSVASKMKRTAELSQGRVGARTAADHINETLRNSMFEGRPLSAPVGFSSLDLTEGKFSNRVKVF